MGDPLKEQGETQAALRQVVDAAGPYLDLLPERLVYDVVCFRYRPTGLSGPEVDDLNRRLGEALLDDGRVFAGTTVYGGRVASARRSATGAPPRPTSTSSSTSSASWAAASPATLDQP